MALKERARRGELVLARARASAPRGALGQPLRDAGGAAAPGVTTCRVTTTAIAADQQRGARARRPPARAATKASVSCSGVEGVDEVELVPAAAGAAWTVRADDEPGLRLAPSRDRDGHATASSWPSLARDRLAQLVADERHVGQVGPRLIMR